MKKKLITRIKESEETLKEKFEEMFNKHNLEELYLIQNVLEKEIRLSKTAKSEGFE